MIKQLLIALLALACSTVAFAQKSKKEPPNYKAIKRLTEERGSAQSYDSLFTRFLASDTLLTTAEYRLLYYGYFFRPEFNEGDGGTAMDSVRSLYRRDTLMPQDWKTLASYAALAIDSAPYDLGAHKAIVTAYRMLGDSQRYQVYKTRRNGILDAIFSTGDGRSDTTAFHVASVGHEYDILRLLGLSSKGQSLTANLCDYLELRENEYDLDGLYFDVSQLFEVRQRTWLGKDGPTRPKTSSKKKKGKK